MAIIIIVFMVVLVAVMVGYFFYTHKNRQQYVQDDASESEGLAREGRVNQTVTNSIVTRD